MILPDNISLYESELAFFWFDESGILFACTKDTPRTLDKQKRTYELIRKISENKKVCLLSDTTHSQLIDEETRNYIATEMPEIFTAMAVISETALGKAPATVFLNLQGQPIPIQMFSDIEEAKEWLKQYL